MVKVLGSGSQVPGEGSQVKVPSRRWRVPGGESQVPGPMYGTRAPSSRYHFSGMPLLIAKMLEWFRIIVIPEKSIFLLHSRYDRGYFQLFESLMTFWLCAFNSSILVYHKICFHLSPTSVILLAILRFSEMFSEKFCWIIF